ncbi:hypothetical protein H0H93_001281 [Arthromyces matolae]|nr:hypothetical protein H0H93_001281 [Arthromyces matolae]
MLPKVATHILHSTTRAVTSIQHQSYTIRNVLQSQSSSSSSNSGLAPWNNSGSSHWGNNNGPGTGSSAKYGAGSRYNAYTSSVRAVTQANPTISSNDGSFTHSDEQQEDLPPNKRPSLKNPIRTRTRSNSLSIPSQNRDEKLGVLKTVQLHARSRHAFASQNTPSTPIDEAQPRPVLVRRNSTSAPLPTQSFDPTIPAPSPTPSRRNSVSSISSSHLDPASPQTVDPPSHENKAEVSHAAKQLILARNSGNSVRAAEAVRKFRQDIVHPTVREFNSALEALQATRRPGEPLTLMLDTYNDMLRHGLLPNVHTYVALIDSLTARDQEVHSAITALEQRIKQRALTGSNEAKSDDGDRLRIDMLHKENNFGTAMTLFETVLAMGGNRQLTPHTYASLLRSCANHSNSDAAIHVFAQQQQRETILPSTTTYLEMIRCFTNAGLLQSVEDTFEAYRKAIEEGELHLAWSKDTAEPARETLIVWNQMIESYFRFDRADKAIGLLDEMLAVDRQQMGVVPDPPPVSSATFTTVITGFCQIGDVETAFTWFNRLLAQGESSQDPYEPTGSPMKPDHVAWRVMLDALAVKGMIEQLNRIFVVRAKDAPEMVRAPERYVFYSANMGKLPSVTDDEQYAAILSLLVEHVLNSSNISSKQRAIYFSEVAHAYLDRKMYDQAVNILSAFVKVWQNGDHKDAPISVHEIRQIQIQFTERLYEVTQGNVSYAIVQEIARIASTLRIAQPPSTIPFFLHAYGLSRASESLPLADMTLRDWELVLMAANTLATMEHSSSADESLPQVALPNFAFQGLESLIRDLAKYNVPFEKMDSNLIRQVIKMLNHRIGVEKTVELFQEIGLTGLIDNPSPPASVLGAALEASSSSSEANGSDSGYASDTPLRHDSYLTKAINEDLNISHIDKLADRLASAYTKFRLGVENGRAPSPVMIARLIEAFGRNKGIEEMHYLYSVAQRVLQGLEHNKEHQAEGWFKVENAMVIGLAHYGDIENAHVYRRRIIEQGGAPSADAYGALIFNVKDTTDDATNALELFNESQSLQILPNLYLYNNIISKLAKARKADLAIELFQQMKAQGVFPSSVTFGALVGACARVGDIHSAEFLFSEMTMSRNFKPRIPPYNTMMQMYTTTKPDRARVLHFYEEMRKVKIAPSAHTYKLLLDAYGSIEPIDLNGMETVWQSLNNRNPGLLQSTHYVSLLNAYGCVSKDFNKAVEVIDNMKIPRDALIYEALFNVLVTHRRGDLFPEYINKMHLEGVHMTAYVANSLIRGYSLLNEIEKARQVFESLEDPPQGVAAPNNHAPHSPLDALSIDANVPVYREPSTWEAMIRAELGSGNREGAVSLLERLKARRVCLHEQPVLKLTTTTLRQYPEAVFLRISGILVDHSQVPPL